MCCFKIGVIGMLILVSSGCSRDSSPVAVNRDSPNNSGKLPGEFTISEAEIHVKDQKTIKAGEKVTVEGRFRVAGDGGKGSAVIVKFISKNGDKEIIANEGSVPTASEDGRLTFRGEITAPKRPADYHLCFNFLGKRADAETVVKVSE